jgi:mannose-1-phosphate guanylyltransferase
MGRSGSREDWSLVLAGGDGTRLQDLTRQLTGVPIPKQYCRIVGTQSLLESTLARSALFAPPRRTMVVVNRNHLAVGHEQLRVIDPDNILVQPCNRDTGPGLLFALLRLKSRLPNATVAVFPSDHYVNDDHAFVAHVNRATNLVALHPEKIVVLGIRPSHPEPGYGYITPARPVPATATTGRAFRVAAFREKPSPDLARSLLASGSLWNSFVMVFQLTRMLELLRRVAPNEFTYMCAVSQDPQRLASVYADLTPWNFSSDFLARIPQHLIVLPVDDVHWSDWGTREAIETTLRMLNQVPPWSNPPRPRTAA